MPEPDKTKGSQKDTPLEMRDFDHWTSFFNELIPWWKLPSFLGLVRLLRLRDVLRKKNLHDTDKIPVKFPLPPPDPSVRHLDARTPDGTFNDLDHPRMGAVGARFGRNVPLENAIPDPEPELLEPSPRVVSRELLTRKEFIPASSLNLLAASWIQFMVHDWVSHGKNQKENPFKIKLTDDDPWPGADGEPRHAGFMEIRRTSPDPTRDPNDSNPVPTYLNTETHWWDASQIYGTSAATIQSLRSGVDGKLTMTADGNLPVNPATGIHQSGVTGNWWVGLAMLHTLFAREHNSICDRLKADFPTWSDEELFHKARLVNAALLAKIHTVEWTPAIIAHPTTEVGVPANWWGLTGEDGLLKKGRFSDSDVISGIPGSDTDHHGVPYSLTEEFIAVYRLHPLIPDNFAFRAVAGDRQLGGRIFPDVFGPKAKETMDEVSFPDLFYSFGVAHPGAVTLHNYPKFLQRFERHDGPLIDLAAVDILRDRERGVPRYNEFRRLLHLEVRQTFEELTENPEWREELRRVYDNDVNRVDLMVGMYAETPPPGFGFSDTAFRIFILMATRRLKSDRFFTVDYRPEIYTQAGIDWIENNNMLTVLLRHCPELMPAMGHLKNAFKPFKRTGA